MQDIFEEFAEKICSTCKTKCDESYRGIHFVFGAEKSVKCVDYERDKTKIQKPEKILITTAKKKKSLMREII